MKKALPVLFVALLGGASAVHANDGDCGGSRIHTEGVYNTPQHQDPDRIRLGTLNVYYNGGQDRYCAKLIFSEAYRGTRREGSMTMLGCESQLDSTGFCPKLIGGVNDPGPDTQSLGPIRQPGYQCISVAGWLNNYKTGPKFNSGWLCR